jgi:16S rRNA (cytosine967-C5)-methyltransferase
MEPELTEIQDLYQGVRGTAVKILTRVEQTDAYLDKLLDMEMNESDFSPQDKRLLNELVHGVLRNQSKLDWVLTGFYHGQYSKVVPNVRNALRISLYQIIFLTRIPHHAAVNQAVEFVKKYRGQKLADTMNGLLRNIARNVENIRYPVATADEIQYLSVVHSHPTWLVKRWHSRFGFEATESLCKSDNMRPFLTLRPNPNIEVKTNIGLNLISISTLSGEAPVQTGSKLQVIRQKFEEVSVFLHELKRIAFDVFCLVSVVVVMCRLLIYEFR